MSIDNWWTARNRNLFQVIFIVNINIEKLLTVSPRAYYRVCRWSVGSLNRYPWPENKQTITLHTVSSFLLVYWIMSTSSIRRLLSISNLDFFLFISRLEHHIWHSAVTSILFVVTMENKLTKHLLTIRENINMNLKTYSPNFNDV